MTTSYWSCFWFNRRFSVDPSIMIISTWSSVTGIVVHVCFRRIQMYLYRLTFVRCADFLHHSERPESTDSPGWKFFQITFALLSKNKKPREKLVVTLGAIPVLVLLLVGTWRRICCFIRMARKESARHSFVQPTKQSSFGLKQLLRSRFSVTSPNGAGPGRLHVESVDCSPSGSCKLHATYKV